MNVPCGNKIPVMIRQSNAKFFLYLSSHEHQVIAMSHLVRAAGYEYQKMGKLVVEGDFEGYYELVKI